MKRFHNEPEVATLQDGNHHSAYSWYKENCSHDDAKDFILDYLKTNNRVDDATLVNKIPKTKIPLTVAWLSRMALRGVIFRDESQDYFENAMASLIETVDEDDESEEDEKASNVQDHIRAKVSSMIADIDDMIDKCWVSKVWNIKLYDQLLAVEFPASMANRIANHYRPKAEEIQSAYDNNDPEIKEGYAGYSKIELRDMSNAYTSIVNDAERYAITQKKQRKSRKLKVQSVDKQIKDLKYLKDSSQYKISSANPAKLIGASEVWLFNTKYLTITVMRAIDRAGFKVKGTSILNYDENKSMTKKAGRKIEEYLKILVEGGKRDLNKLMDTINTKPAMFTNRTSENTIIARII